MLNAPNYILSSTSILAFYLAYIRICYMTFYLPFYKVGILSAIIADILPDSLAFYPDMLSLSPSPLSVI